MIVRVGVWMPLQVIKLLGKGSYGKVYKVERESDGQIYAMKETDLVALSQNERMDAVNEVRLLVSINHANVVSAMLCGRVGLWNYPVQIRP